MAFITLAGTLRDPTSELAVGDQIRFTHKSTTGETVEGAVSVLTIDPSGTYSKDLQYGLVLVEYKDVRTSQFKNLGVATVNGSNPATSIPELLNALVPVSSAELIEFQAILADAVTARNEAEAFANSIDLINDLSQAYIFNTVAEYKASSIVFPDGKTIHLNDRNADFTKIAGTGTANTFNIIASAESSQSIRLITRSTVSPVEYGADNSGATDSSDAWLQLITDAVDNFKIECKAEDLYKIKSSVSLDLFNNLVIIGNGATIDFQVNNAFSFGDFTLDANSQFTQTNKTVSNIYIDSLNFIDSESSWNGTNFAHARPLYFSAAKNVYITRCTFLDNHVGAIDFAAPCEHVTVDACEFTSSQEASTSYGVRLFAYVVGASLNNLDTTTGQLSYARPTEFHKQVTVKNCTFNNKGYSILSWNVYDSNYINNTINKPLIRGISITNWNVNCLVADNKYNVEDNVTAALSSVINIGVGSRNITISNEHYTGAMSGNGVNAFVKVIDHGGVNESILIKDNVFDIINAAGNVNIGPNVEVSVVGNLMKRQVIGGGTKAAININESPASSPTFNQPRIEIRGNRDVANARIINLIGEPPGTPSPLIVKSNIFEELLVNRMIVMSTSSSLWEIKASDNELKLGAFNYVENFGSGSYKLSEADRFARSMVTIDLGGDTAPTIDYRYYGGDVWFLKSSVTSDILITNPIVDGQKLTIIIGSAIKFTNGPFKLVGGVDLTLGTNDSIEFVSRAGFWFETGRALT